MIQKILSAPHPILAHETEKVTKIDKKIKTLVQDMIDTLVAQRNPMGVGLSANQIGVQKRIFVMRPEEDGKVTVCIDPKILEIQDSKKKRKATLEGCLSIPRIWGNVLRPKKVKLSYRDITGMKHETWFDGFEAVIIQHECDHLDGRLFTQRVLEQERTLYKEVGDELEPYDM